MAKRSQSQKKNCLLCFGCALCKIIDCLLKNCLVIFCNKIIFFVHNLTCPSELCCSLFHSNNFQWDFNNTLALPSCATLAVTFNLWGKYSGIKLDNLYPFRIKKVTLPKYFNTRNCFLRDVCYDKTTENYISIIIITD